MQDVEFTVQEGKLWMLQTRAGKRTAEAALKIAGYLANEGGITQSEAIMQINPLALDQLLPSQAPRGPKLLRLGQPGRFRQTARHRCSDHCILPWSTFPG